MRISFMKYLIGLFSCVFLFSMLAYAQETTTDNATPGLSGKDLPSRSISSPNASVPNKISYQGLLTTSGGAPVADGTYELKFELFNVVSSGAALWSETQSGVNVYKGTFSVLLGAVTPLTGIFYQPLWVEVTANSGPGIAAPIVFAPRTEMASAAYALGPLLKSGENYYLYSGAMGIGAPPEGFRVDVVSSGYNFIRAKSTNAWAGFVADKADANDNNYYILRTGGADKWLLGTTGSNDFKLGPWSGSNIVPYFSVDTLGKVGIGTGTPDKLLEVAGPLHVADTLFVGSSTQTGILNLYQNGTTSPTLFVGPYPGYGGQLQLREESDATYLYAQPDADGTGGFFSVNRTTGSNGFVVDGNYLSSLQPRVGIYGSSHLAVFNMAQTANSSVVLPDSSISAAEMFDEPGIARGHSSSSIAVANTGVTSIISAAITVPGPGYIVARANNYAGITGNDTLGNIVAGIMESPTANPNTINEYVSIGFSNTPFLSSTNFWGAFAPERVFSVASAGTYTYYLNAIRGYISGTASVFFPRLQLTYFPTSYGTVSASVPESEVAQFSNVDVNALEATDQSGIMMDAHSSNVVDLRELELKAARARIEAERAERELLEAQVKQQQANDNEPR
jgi:hypothetical protein